MPRFRHRVNGGMVRVAEADVARLGSEWEPVTAPVQPVTPKAQPKRRSRAKKQ